MTASKQKKGRPTEAFNISDFSSMEQMAGSTGIPVNVLKAAKKSGCLFVKHGRCDLLEFLRWFFAQDAPDGEKVDWAKRDKRAVALIREHKLEEAKNKVIDWSIAERFVRYLVAQCFFAELDRLAQEFPANLKGKNEIEIHAECLRQTEIVKKSLKTAIELWAEKKGQP